MWEIKASMRVTRLVRIGAWHFDPQHMQGLARLHGQWTNTIMGIKAWKQGRHGDGMASWELT